MSGVVMRCQNCGTTQAGLGECEACHDGDVRYFCPNHAPGRWLDEPSCSACGARVGVPGRTERVMPRPTPAPPPISRGRSVPARPPARRPPPLEEVEPEPEVWSGPVHDPRVGRSALEELLRAGMRGGSPIGPSLPDIGMKVVSGFGCLRRLVMVVFLLMMLAVAFFFGLLGFSPPATLVGDDRHHDSSRGNYWATLDVASSTQADTGAGSGSRLSARQHSS